MTHPCFRANGSPASIAPTFPTLTITASTPIPSVPSRVACFISSFLFLSSFFLILFEILFEVDGLEFISLQKNIGEEQIKNFKYNNKLHNFASFVDTSENSFEDTIEIIRNLDLVITTDTAIAHLSSTLGINTWVLLSSRPNWRWFLNKNDTPWYQNTRLFRQKKPNDWSRVLIEIKNELTKEFSL